MNWSSKHTALILAPHTDDGELGCGGTIAKLIENGVDVYYAAFSSADASLPPEYPHDQLRVEVIGATQRLGISREKLIVFNYEVRKLNYVRQEILEDLIKLRDEIKPNLIFIPSSRDIHQDHLTIYNEGIRAFKFQSILGYELVWNNLSFSTDCFVPIEERHVELKLEALMAYKTQHNRSYMSREFIKSLARVRGTQVGVKYAESFEVVRWIFD